MKRVELAAYLAVIAALVVAVVGEARANASLTAGIALEPKELYRALARKNSVLQVVDVRDDVEEYEDARVPGAIPFPGCDPSKTPEEAMKRIVASVPTVVVSADGDAATFERCKASFASARNLAGGQEGWSDEGLPEDTGEYVPPKPKAGGGCL